jgi:hypothetical protein
MSHKEDVDLIHKLLDSLPKKHEDKNLQLAYQQGYLIGLLAHLVGDDFQTRGKINQRIEDLK